MSSIDASGQFHRCFRHFGGQFRPTLPRHEHIVKDFFEFLRNMGGMHDAFVESFCWKPAEQTMEFRFEDLYSNFADLPEYPGRTPGAIILRGTSNVRIDVATNEPLRVFEFLPQEGTSDAVQITFSPSGKISTRFLTADFPTSRLRGFK
jgi:hypothetical protein